MRIINSVCGLLGCNEKKEEIDLDDLFDLDAGAEMLLVEDIGDFIFDNHVLWIASRIHQSELTDFIEVDKMVHYEKGVGIFNSIICGGNGESVNDPDMVNCPKCKSKLKQNGLIS